MSKNILVIALLTFIFAPVALAANNGKAETNTGVGSVNQVQNQVQTQNQGEDTALQVKTEEALTDQHGVSSAVQSLLAMPDRKGGIGSEVRTIAQAQQQDQLTLDKQLAEFNSRPSFMNKLFGADKETLKELKRIQEQNQLRIKNLEQLRTQTTNQGELDQLELAIEAMVAQNTSLADQIGAAEAHPGIFGWIFRLFGLQ